MIIRGLDSEGDWLFGKGKNDYRTGINAISQNIETRLKSWKNDCFFALNEGVDYKNLLGMGKQAFLDIDVKRVLLLSEGVLKIDEFESTLDRDERDYTLISVVTTIYGELEVNV